MQPGAGERRDVRPKRERGKTHAIRRDQTAEQFEEGIPVLISTVSSAMTGVCLIVTGPLTLSYSFLVSYSLFLLGLAQEKFTYALRRPLETGNS